MTTMTQCSVCSTPTNKRCSRCKAISLCTPECMKSAWPRHKSDCKNIVAARQTVQNEGLQLRGTKSIPSSMSGEEFLALNAMSMRVYDKHGIEDLPMKGSTMDSKKKIDFFLDFLDVHDSSSPKHAEASLPQKLFLNRRFNNCLKHAVGHFTEKEYSRLLEQMKERRIGSSDLIA